MGSFTGGLRGRIVACALTCASTVPACASVIYDQTDSCTNTYVSSETIATIPFYDSLMADDFSVPAGATWDIEQVSAQGSYFGGGQTAGSFNVAFYADSSGAPGAPVAGCVYSAAPYGEVGGAFNIALPAACSLEGGPQGSVYWVSVQARLNANPNVDWGWRERSVQSGNGAHAEYPGGSDPECATWMPKQDCFSVQVSPDQCFSLVGTDSIFRNGFE